MNNMYDNELEDQIGDYGLDENTKENNNKEDLIDPTNKKQLGKLKHSLTTELTDDEIASKENFLKKSVTKQTNISKKTPSNDIMSGWIPIEKSEMGIRASFYPENWQFRVRPATVEAIKNWSAIDENNLAVSNNVFNEIMKACVSIYTDDNEKFSWSKINSWDRFWFILKVREYTFINGESIIQYDEACDECGVDVHYILNSDSLVYEFPDEDIVEKHWNQTDKIWYINPKDYGLDGYMIKLYIPTLEKDDAILNWGIRKQQQGKSINTTFIKFLPWMLSKAPKDDIAFEKQVTECFNIYKSWDSEMFSFMDDIIRNITINPSEKLKNKCFNCGEEVTTSVRFPNGISSIFAVQNKYRKFGSK